MRRSIDRLVGIAAALLLSTASPAAAMTVTGVDDDAVPVTGADRPSTAAPLLAPGRYVDTFAAGGAGELGAMGTTKYYTITARRGVHPYVSVTMSPPDADPDDGQLFGVEAVLLDSTIDVCTSNGEDDIPTLGRHQPVTVVLNGPVFGDPTANVSCPIDGPVILQVNRIGEAFAGTALEAEIVVRMEPPADAAGLPGPAPTGPELPEPAHVAPTDLAGGRSFAQAPALASGATYRDSIGTGENRYYRIPLRWGQRFAYSINEVGPADPALAPLGAEITADVFNPVREHDAFSSTAADWFGTQPGPTMSADTDYPVRYTNRDGVLQAPYALDGDYYLRLSAHRSTPASSTGFVLTVTIDGAPQTGPVYLPIDTGSIDTGSIDTGSIDPPQSSRDGMPAPGGSAGAPTAQADPVAVSGFPAWGWWAVAVAAALGLGCLLPGWRRRSGGRRASSTPPR